MWCCHKKQDFLLSLAGEYSTMCTYINHILFTHSSVDRRLGCFLALAIANNAKVNMSTDMVLYPYFISFVYMPKSRIGSCRSSIFNNLRNLHTVFHSGWPNLHSLQQCARVPFSSQNFLTFAIFCLLVGNHSKRYEVILWFLICISLIISKVEFFHLPIGHL